MGSERRGGSGRRRWAATLTALTAFATLAVGGGAARAQAPGTDVGAREAEQRFKEGKDLFERGRYAEARVKFAQACGAHRTPNCPKNLGVTEYALKDYPAAATHLRDYLRAPDVPAGDASLARIKMMYDDAFAHAGHVEIEAPPGAEVTIDGASVGNAPLRDAIDVVPGKHAVEMHHEGASKHDDIEVLAGQTVKVRDETSTTPAPAPVATMSASGLPKTPPPPPPRTDGETPAETDHPSAAKWITVGALGVVAIAAIGVGIGFVAGGSSASSDADRLSTELGPDTSRCAGATGGSDPRCGDLADANAAKKRDPAIGGTLIGVGVVSAGAAIAAWLLWPKPHDRGSAWLAPSLARGEAGVTLGGRF